MELKNRELVKLFRKADEDWVEFFKDGKNVFYTRKSKYDKHNYDNHVHLFIRREDGKLGYNIKKDGSSIEGGIVGKGWTANDFKTYYSGGKKRKTRKTKRTKKIKRKTKRKTKKGYKTRSKI